MQASDRLGGWSRSDEPATERYYDRIVDDLEGDAAVVELTRQAQVGLAYVTVGAWGRAVQGEDGVDVGVTAGSPVSSAGHAETARRCGRCGTDAGPGSAAP